MGDRRPVDAGLGPSWQTDLVEQLIPQFLAQQPFVESTGAGYVQVPHPGRVVASLEQAARMALGEQRTIVVNCPTEFQWEEVQYEPATLAIRRPVAEPSDDELDTALGIIASARKPIVLVGNGVVQADAAGSVLRLAERIGAPLATTLRARGLFSAAQGCLGVFGTVSTDVGAELITESDCVIALGASMNVWTTAHNSLLKDRALVHVDMESAQIGRYAPVAASVVADAESAAEEIIRWLDDGEIEPSTFRSHALDLLDGAPTQWQATISDGYGLGAIISELVNALPSDTTIAFDGGRFLGEAFKYASAPSPRQQVLSTSFGAVGLGMGAAIGAAVAAPHSPTLLITGDGGYMMSGLAELSSATRCGQPLVVAICNDGSYGAEYDQYVNKGMNPELSLFEWPSFADSAIALGAIGLTIEGADDLDDALKILANPPEESVVLDIRIGAGDVPEVPH